LFDWFYRIITTKKYPKKKQHGSDFVTYISRNSELGTKLIDDKREEDIKFESIYRETNSKEIALSLLFFILILTAYKREEIT